MTESADNVMGSEMPIILTGAFDRHNFGDLLFPHIVAALLAERKLLFAGLADRDLGGLGGHQVKALPRLAAEWRDRPVNLIHAGGEILTCDTWQAAVMLLPAEEALATVSHFEAREAEKVAWASAYLKNSGLAPYAVGRNLFPKAASIMYNAVGGVDIDKCSPAMRDEVTAKLREAEAVSVRDRVTLQSLERTGIAARLVPDPAVMVAELFGRVIQERTQQGEVAKILKAFPQGYIAVQFGADFDDDETLSVIAAQLDQVMESTGAGVVFFRAGAAPWHDDLQRYRRTGVRMRTQSCFVFESLYLWDICALIASSRAYCGSSLHGRIVAMTYALPRVNLHPPGHTAPWSKQEAYAATWEQGIPAAVDVHDMAQGMREALSVSKEQLYRLAEEAVKAYRQGFTVLSASIK